MKKFSAYQLNNKRRRDNGDCAGTQDHSVGVGGEGKRPRVERVKKEKPREGTMLATLVYPVAPHQGWTWGWVG